MVDKKDSHYRPQDDRDCVARQFISLVQQKALEIKAATKRIETHEKKKQAKERSDNLTTATTHATWVIAGATVVAAAVGLAQWSAISKIGDRNNPSIAYRIDSNQAIYGPRDIVLNAPMWGNDPQ